MKKFLSPFLLVPLTAVATAGVLVALLAAGVVKLSQQI